MHTPYSAAIFLRTVFLILTIIFASLICTFGQTPRFNIVKPGTTGVPGEEVRAMRLDPAGNLWIAARYPFWGDSAVAMLSADQLAYSPLPGGGFDTGAWRVWSNEHHPIPSPYLNDMEFASDGTMWIASDGGLTRFRPNAQNQQDMWFTFTTANSPLTMDSIGSIAVDSQNNVWIANNNVNSINGALFKLNTTTNQWTRIPLIGADGENLVPNRISVGNNDRILISFHMGTPGFAEYNGTSWIIRQQKPTSAFGELVEDAQGNVWGTTAVDGLFKWNGSSFQRWQTIDGKSELTSIGLDRNGAVYVLTWSGPVYKMIGDTPVFFTDADNIPSDFIGMPNGDIWINNNGGNGVLGTVRHYTESGQLLERFNAYNSGLHDYFVNKIESDSQGNMWFAAGEGGLTRMLGSDGASTASTRWRNWGRHNDESEPYPWTFNEPMTSVFEDANGIFWMGGNGIGRWNSQTGQFTNFWNWQNSNIDTSLITAFAKRDGVIWVGSGGSGAFWLNSASGQWVRVPLSTPEAYSANNVKAMTIDTQNNLWVASEFALRKFEAGSNSAYTLYHHENSGLPDSGLNDVEADPRGGIWVATQDGLGRFDGSTWTVYNQQNSGLPGNNVSDVARRASDGLIAVSSFQGMNSPYTGGVSTFDGQTWKHYTRQNSPLTHWQVESVEFDRNGNLWASTMSEGVVQIMIGNQSASSRAPFDFDGDRKTDIAIFRPTTGAWWISQSSNSQIYAVGFGNSSDKIVPADFTGDGKTDLALFRESTGEWFVLRSDNNTFYGFPFGSAGDKAVPADFDGDGKADPTVFRASNSGWYSILSTTGGVLSRSFGLSEDVPLPNDYDGDGKADLGIFRPSTSAWWIQRSSNSAIFAAQFGASGDKPTPADFTGDGKTDFAFFRPSNSTWYVLRSEDSSFYGFPFGATSDTPVVGDYDGDGRADAAVFRASDNGWYLLRSTAGFTAVTFGATNDKPIPSAFVP